MNWPWKVEMRKGKFFMRIEKSLSKLLYSRIEERNAAASSDNPMRLHQP